MTPDQLSSLTLPQIHHILTALPALYNPTDAWQT